MRLITLDNLQIGMQAGQDIIDEHNRLLLSRGAQIKGPYINRLRQMGMPALYVMNEHTADITVPDVIKPAARTKAINNLTQTFNAVEKSVEGATETSLDEAREHVRSKRFMDTFKSASKDGLDQILGDVDTLIEQLMEKDVVVGLNSIKLHDTYTFQHSIDVTIMGILLARKIGWDKIRIQAFGVGCILHDIGKIFIEKQILNKPDRLDEDEYEVIKAHPTLGFDLVKTIAPTLGYLIPHVGFQHHERQDGSGYPRGIKGTNDIGKNEKGMIHDFGAVSAVADIYDAMTSDRPYRAGWPPDRVNDFIRQLSGSHLNSRVVDIFLKTVAPYPIGTGVKVITQEYGNYEGVVVDVDDSVIARPKIRLLFDPDGEEIDPIDLDLQERTDINVCSVRGPEPQMQPLGSSSPTGEGEDDEVVRSKKRE